MKQKGFTLIELLVALGIGVVLLGVIVGAIFLVVRGTGDISTESVALSDIDNAAHWLARDLVVGQSSTLLEGQEPVNTVNITWIDYTGGLGNEIAHYITYTHSGTQLLRGYDSADDTTIVGRNLTYVGFSINGTLVKVTLTVSPEDAPRSTVTRTYIIQMRAKG